MKHLLKHPSHFMKLIALLLFFSVFNCQKEDINTPNQTQELSSVSYTVTSLSKLTKLQPVVENIKKISPKTNTYNRGFGDFLPLENIDTTRVIQYTDTTGYSTYTFKIESDDETSINFENLYLLETEQGYIGYILRYEPDENWYYSEVNYTPEGDHVFNIPTCQGDITKYSLEREVIWSTKEEDLNRNDYSMRSGGMYIEECMYSTYQECSNDYEGNPGGAWHPRGPRCDGPFRSNVAPSCQMVWISTGGNGDGSNNGGGTSGNDPCLTTGTTIIGQQPISGIGSGCTPNEGTGILLSDVETTCTLGVNVTASVLYCLQINSFTQMELQNYIENPDNACQVGEMAVYLAQNQCSEVREDVLDILVSANNNSLITAFPFVKYPDELAEEYTETYPNFTNFLKEEILEIKDDQEVVNALIQVGVLGEEEIIEALTWGKGPEIRITPLSSNNVMLGKYNPTPLGEDGASYGPNVIEINSYFVDLLEEDLSSNNPQYDIKALKFFIAIVILHEITHYADFQYEGNTYFENNVETGNLFEDNLFHDFTVYGEQVTLTIDNFTSIVQQYFLTKD